ncbi:MAG: hypothetical protein J6X49_07195 [Victivallales bacterium]|nr:hypothetical protein [Victivallales bacterium]
MTLSCVRPSASSEPWLLGREDVPLWFFVPWGPCISGREDVPLWFSVPCGPCIPGREKESSCS